MEEAFLWHMLMQASSRRLCLFSDFDPAKILMQMNAWRSQRMAGDDRVLL